MSLRVYNTLSKQKEIFEPVEPGKVRMYLCGPTVYKESHIGHAVGPVVFDTFKRYLVYKGYEVTWVVNITDVEDKIIIEAAAQGCGVMELAERIGRSYCDALAQLGIHSIDHMPKASEHIGEIIEMIEGLISKGYAYLIEADVYFNTAKDEDYGKLSNRKLEDQAGQRDLVVTDKRNPGDFALWKASKPGEPEETCFESPWGMGRPGWHIECSAMSMKYLGSSFDIHGGGMDLIFPHHENEIAQSESYSGKPFAKYWAHNGLTRLNTKKLSKSDPEMEAVLAKMTLSHLLSNYGGELLRFFLLSTHYRRPIEFSDLEISSKKKGLDAFYRLFERIKRATGKSPYDEHPTLRKPQLDNYDEAHHPFIQELLTQRTKFLDSMDDDFNTAGAISVLFLSLSIINRFMDQHEVETATAEEPRELALAAARTVISDARILGLFEQPAASTDGQHDSLNSDLLDLLVQLRTDAKTEKNYALADRIRKELSSLGVTLEDGPDGTRWRLE